MEPIRTGHLSSVDRFGVLSDTFALLKSSDETIDQVLLLWSAFAAETDYTVWNELSSEALELLAVFQYDRCAPALRARLCSMLFGPLAARFSWDVPAGEEPLKVRRGAACARWACVDAAPDRRCTRKTMLRALAFRMAGRLGDAAVIAEAKRRFDEHVSGVRPLHPDLRLPAFRITVANGGEAELERVRSIYRTTTQHEEKLDALSCMGATPDRGRLLDLMRFGLSDDVRLQDALYVYGYVCACAGCAGGPLACSAVAGASQIDLGESPVQRPAVGVPR